MSKNKIYLTKTVWEKNATNGLDIHKTLKDALVLREDNLNNGALYVKLYECSEIFYESLLVNNS